MKEQENFYALSLSDFSGLCEIFFIGEIKIIEKVSWEPSSPTHEVQNISKTFAWRDLKGRT